MIGLRELAAALGGEVVGGQVAAPAPGHSARDRSLAVRPSPTAPDGFVCWGFAGEDWRHLRDHVKERLGFSARVAPKSQREAQAAPADDRARIRLARKVWNEAKPARGSIVERYLRSRGLDLPPDADRVIRFHPRGGWKDGDILVHSPMMVAAMRSIATGEIMAVHRTRLSSKGEKLDRRMLGAAAGTAIMIDAVEISTSSDLAIAEGIESALASRHLGFSPVWALGSAGAIAAFPVVPNVSSLRMLAENHAASQQAVRRCAVRWHAAFRNVAITTPIVGSDMNDVWLMGGGAL